MEENLLLDPAIRTWVLIPMVLVVLFIGLARSYLDRLLGGGKPRPAAPSTLKSSAILLRMKAFQTNHRYLPEESFLSRRAFFMDLKAESNESDGSTPANPMLDPLHMMDMMKGNMLNLVPNLAMMGIVSTLFSGFVVAKFPFPLPEAFRMMLHRGIDLPSLDVSYATSLSMYFLIFFGMRGLLSLLLDEQSPMDASAMGAMMPPPQLGMFGAASNDKQMDAEKENIEVLKHKFEFEDIDERMAGMFADRNVEVEQKVSTSESEVAQKDSKMMFASRKRRGKKGKFR